MTVLRSGAASDVGRIRSANEDRFLDGSSLFAVADGMGGHAGGEVAAEIALDVLQRRFSVDPTATGLMDAVRRANTAVWERSHRDVDVRGMGTTLIAAALVSTPSGDRLVVANVGDSRGYRFSGGRLAQMTVDHSVAEELVARGELSEAEAAVHPHRHILTRALGVAPDVDVDAWELTPGRGERFVLCSDGLTNEVGEARIARVLSDVADPGRAAETLVALANEHGGSDNITVVVLDVVVADGAEDPAVPGASLRAGARQAAGVADGAGSAVGAGAADGAGAAAGAGPADGAGSGPTVPETEGTGGESTGGDAATDRGPGGGGPVPPAHGVVPDGPGVAGQVVGAAAGATAGGAPGARPADGGGPGTSPRSGAGGSRASAGGAVRRAAGTGATTAVRTGSVSARPGRGTGSVASPAAAPADDLASADLVSADRAVTGSADTVARHVTGALNDVMGRRGERSGEGTGRHAGRRVTLRVVLFAVLLVAVVVGAGAVVHYYAEDAWYVGLDGDHVAVYQGRPGGFLGFAPRLLRVTAITTSSVAPAAVSELQADVAEPSLQAADQFITNLHAEYCDLRPTPPACTTPAPPGAAAAPDVG